MSDYVAECRINGKEKILLLNETQKNNVVAAMGIKAATVNVNGNVMRTDCIMLVSKFADWRKSDESAQNSRGKYRCPSCFTVNDNGNRCQCSTERREMAGRYDDYADTPERLRAGWVKCVGAAFASNVKLAERMRQGNPFARGFGKIIETYAIAPEEAGLPTGTW